MKFIRVRLGYEGKVGGHTVLLRKLPRSSQHRYWAVEIDGKSCGGRYDGMRRAKAAAEQWAARGLDAGA